MDIQVLQAFDPITLGLTLGGGLLKGIFGAFGKRREARRRQKEAAAKAAKLSEVAEMIKNINPAQGLAAQQSGALSQMQAMNAAQGISGGGVAGGNIAGVLSQFDSARRDRSLQQAQMLEQLFSDDSFAASAPGAGGSFLGTLLSGAAGGLAGGITDAAGVGTAGGENMFAGLADIFGNKSSPSPFRGYRPGGR